MPKTDIIKAGTHVMLKSDEDVGVVMMEYRDEQDRPRYTFWSKLCPHTGRYQRRDHGFIANQFLVLA